MKLLITGHCGYIGRNLVSYLAGCRGVEITGIDRKEGHCVTEPYTEHLVAQAEVVVHMASWISILKEDDVDAIVRDNIVSVAKIAQWCAKHKTELVFLSSTCVHQKDDFGEYALSKRLAEGMIRDVMDGEAPYVFIRPSNVCGFLVPEGVEGPENDHILPKLFEASRTRTPIQIYGDGSQVRDYVHVQHICEAVASACSGELRAGEEYEAFSGQTWSLNEVIDLWREKVYKDLKVEYVGVRRSDPPRLAPGDRFDTAPGRMGLLNALDQYTWLLRACKCATT